MKLFPEYLPKGAKERPAVLLLQLILLAQGRNPNITADGDYGEQTAIGVRAFQAEAGIVQDGNFGPQTRASLKVATGIDVDALQKEDFVDQPGFVFDTRP